MSPQRAFASTGRSNTLTREIGRAPLIQKRTLHSQIAELRAKHREVVREQLYSERIPCEPTCGPLLARQYPNAQVYFTTRAAGGEARAAELMKQDQVGE